jgi:hypothetical protein
MSPKWICSPRVVQDFPVAVQCTVLLLILKFVGMQLAVPFLLFLISFFREQNACIQNTINKEIKKEANIKKRRSSGVAGDKSFNPWSQRNELSDWKFCRWRYDTTTACHYFFKSESLQLS